jgi:seryl-tRNA synthetase
MFEVLVMSNEEVYRTEINNIKEDIKEIKQDQKETNAYFRETIEALKENSIRQTEILKRQQENQERQFNDLNKDINKLNNDILGIKKDIDESINTHTKWYQEFLSNNIGKTIKFLFVIILVLLGARIAGIDIGALLKSLF